MKIWARIFKDNKMKRDTVVEDLSSETRTHKIFNSLEKICHEFDLSVPIWLDSNAGTSNVLVKPVLHKTVLLKRSPSITLNFSSLKTTNAKATRSFRPRLCYSMHNTE